MSDPIVVWESVGALVGALLAGAGITGGAVKVNSMRNKKNGTSYVTTAECAERKEVVNKNLDRIHHSVERVDEKVDGITHILLKGSIKDGSK